MDPKGHSHRTKVEAKAKIFFDVCHLFFDLFRFRSHFRLVWIGLKSTQHGLGIYIIFASKVKKSNSFELNITGHHNNSLDLILNKYVSMYHWLKESTNGKESDYTKHYAKVETISSRLLYPCPGVMKTWHTCGTCETFHLLEPETISCPSHIFTA